MKLAPASAAAPTAPPATAAAAGGSAATLLPREMQVARIGRGSVMSELDRAIRLRFEGDGPIADRAVLPDSAAAVQLLSSEHGPTLERAVRSFASIVDAHAGNENLRSVTFLPDEHASKGVSVLNWAERAARMGHSVDDVIEPTASDIAKIRKQQPKLSREEVRAQLRRYAAQEGVKQLVSDEAQHVAFAAAWNSDGHVVMMPDVSRDFLATIGLYRIQPGDQTQLKAPAAREKAAKWAWDTALHEVHHSISPMGARGPEWTSVMEEAVPEVLSPGDIRGAVAKAKADFSLITRPARDTKEEAVDWPAWNRTHLPKPPASQVETAKGRYTDGPALVRELLRRADIDRRTTEGKSTALELLQAEDASRVPRRIADAIVEARGLPDERASKLAELIRKASIGTKTLADIDAFLAAG